MCDHETVALWVETTPHPSAILTQRTMGSISVPLTLQAAQCLCSGQLCWEDLLSEVCKWGGKIDSAKDCLAQV